MGTTGRFEETFKVRFSECDRHSRATPIALFNYLQEIAINHCDVFGFPTDRLESDGYAWMMNRVHFEVDRYPTWKEEIRIQTWPSHMRGLQAIREFRLFRGDGVEFGRATSRWFVVDLARKRIARLPEYVTAFFEIDAARAIDDPFNKLSVVENGAVKKRFHVRFSELDHNQHANSASYVDWLLETVPNDVLDGLAPVSTEIVYRREAALGDELEVSSVEVDIEEPGRRGFQHTLRLLSSDVVLAVGRSAWMRPG